MPPRPTTVTTKQSEPIRTVNVLGLPLPIPSTETALYYGGIAALVGLELIDWPIALAIAVGHEVLTRRQKPLVKTEKVVEPT